MILCAVFSAKEKSSWLSQNISSSVFSLEMAYTFAISTMDNQTADVTSYRRMLFSIAYNMLGSLTDADDLVQETFLNWYRVDRPHVENPKFYLIRALTNRCIDHLRRQQEKRQVYPGVWLPEPYMYEPEKNDPNDDADKKLSIGFLYLLEKLTPIERGVFILHESFDMSYQQICNVFDITYDNCRKQISRARSKLNNENIRFTSDEEKHARVLKRFLEACVSGNVADLVNQLQEDVVFYSDGGGKASAALHPLYGRETVFKFIKGIVEKGGSIGRVEIMSANGLSAAAIYQIPTATIPDLLIAFDIQDNEMIQNIYFLRNPEKLAHFKKFYPGSI